MPPVRLVGPVLSVYNDMATPTFFFAKYLSSKRKAVCGPPSIPDHIVLYAAPIEGASFAPAAAGLYKKLCCVNWLILNICCALNPAERTLKTATENINFILIIFIFFT